MPFDRLRELPHDRRPLGVAEVQAVGRAERPRAGARDVARRFGHREHRAAIRIEIAVAAVAVHRHRQRAIGALDAHDAGAQPGQVDRVGPHHVVVLPIHPALARDRRRAEQREQRASLRRAPGRAARARSRSSCCASARYSGSAIGRRYTGASSVSARFGISATTAPRSFTRSRPSPVTSPMRTACRSHFSKIRSTSASRPA